MQISDLKNKKVLVMGLGLLGGGIATTKWLIRHGAKVTVTDFKTKNQLAPSIKTLGSFTKKIKFILGRHREIDFKTHDIVVVNPDVRRESKFLKIAKKAGIRLENEASLFFKFSRNPIIAVTGTRGKTTTVNWIYHLLKKKFPKAVLTGNSSDNPMLNVLDRLDGKSPVVVELSSWQLEQLPQSKKSAHIAVITNIYRDHLNRHPNIKHYAKTKANIFKNQTKNDFLILNENDFWTKFLLKLKPKSKIIYFPQRLAINSRDFESRYGRHNLENLMIAVLVAQKMGVPQSIIKKAIKTLPQIKYREEVIYQNKNLKVVNDSTATSPDATIAALKRFSREGEVILIAGGTDKNLEFKEWAKAVKKYVKPSNLFLLNSGATKKMIMALDKIDYFEKKPPQLYEDLDGIIARIKNNELRIKDEKSIILFSPGAASFEKFKNEFDRGLKFNLYWKSAV